MASEKYLNKDGLSYLWRKIKSAFTPKERGIEYIRGTWTAASGTWTGVSKDDSLYDGKQIILYMPFAGSGNATLNLTLSDGSSTGPINVYFESTTRFTTQKGANSQLHLIYHKAQTLSNGSTYEGWWFVANRDLDSTAWYIKKQYGRYTTATALYRYQIVFTKSPGVLLPANAVNNSTATSKTLTSVAFDPFGEIFYYSSTTAVSANAKINNGNLYEQHALVDLRYAFNTGTSLAAYDPVYLVVKPQSDGKAKLHSAPISQKLPTSEDGLLYVYLGQAYDTYRIEMPMRKPVYKYINGMVCQVSQASLTAAGPFSTDSNGRLNYTYDTGTPDWGSFTVDTNQRLVYSFTD